MPKRKVKSAKAALGTVEQQQSHEDWRTKPRALRAFEGEWLALANAAGGVEALSSLLGISYPTLYRWAVKRDPVSKGDRFMVQSIAVRLGVLVPPMTPKGEL